MKTKLAGMSGEHRVSSYHSLPKQRAVEHAEMPGPTCKDKILRVFFQKRAIELQPTVII